MKYFVPCLLIFIIIAFLFPAQAHAEDAVHAAAELFGTDTADEALTEDAREISGALEVDGTYDAPGALERLFARAIDKLSQELRNNVQSVLSIVAIALCTALAGAMTGDKGIQGYISIAGVCGAAAMLFDGVNGLVSQTAQALTQMSDYSRAALPAVFSAAAACGAFTAASARYAAVCVAIDVLMSAAQKFIIPLVYAFLALSLSVSLFDNSIIKACQRLTKWVATTFMTLFTIIFSGYIGLTGIVTSGVDAVAARTARTVISATLPVVGGIISDAAATVLAAARLIKNSSGALSLVAVCALSMGAFIMLSVKLLLFRAAAAACDMAGNAKLSAFINDIGTALGILLGLVGCCAIMLFISFTSAIRVAAA